MTEQTTPLATPAQDAFYAAKDAYDAAREAFMSETIQSLTMGMTAKEAIAEARRLTPWAQKQQSTKAAAVRVIARARFEETDTHKAYTALRRAMSVEDNVLDTIKEAPAHVANLREALAALATDESAQWNTERLLDAVLNLQTYGVKAGQWEQVAEQIRDGKSAAEALRVVREQVTAMLLYRSGFRAQSRSTSVTHNLTEDVRREALAGWLDETDRFAR